MKTSSAKSKGRRLQQWTAAQISKLTGLPWGKDECIASREMGQSGVDIRLIGLALEQFPFSVECKNCEKWSIPKWIEQAKENKKSGTDWLLIVTKNRYNPIIIIDANSFFKILKKLRFYKNKTGTGMIRRK